MRKLSSFGGGGSAVLDAEEVALPRPVAASGYAAAPLHPHHEPVDDFAEDTDTEAFLRASGRNRRIRRGLIPRTRTGWIAFGVTGVVVLLALCAGSVLAMRLLATDDRFRIHSSQAIEIDGNSHLSRAQMLSVFGEDVDRNIFKVPLDERQAQLERMPWVDHATVMRLLPNRLRVHVTERVPVAFVRQGGTIGLVDASGVLLDIPPDAPGNPAYTFPVVTGIRAQDEPAARAQRMRMFAAFLKDLDSDGKGTSSLLSEIDLSDPEDVKALIPDHNAEVLVHFGDKGFLDRYHRFNDHIAEWRTQYPRLSSVDMRYERQVVLQMPPKDSTVAPGDAAQAAAGAAVLAKANVPPVRPQAAPVAPKVVAAATLKAVSAAPKAVAAAPKAVAGPVAVKAASPVPAKAPAPVVTKAAPVAVAVKRGDGKAVSPAKEAAMRKRVEAIKLWMAKREKMRAAAASKAGAAN